MGDKYFFDSATGLLHLRIVDFQSFSSWPYFSTLADKANNLVFGPTSTKSNYFSRGGVDLLTSGSNSFKIYVEVTSGNCEPKCADVGSVPGAIPLPVTSTPSNAPTKQPTAPPTSAPTKAPSVNPTAAPTKAPSAAPTKAPSANPTSAPTKAPSSAPTKAPTKAPSANPTAAPTKAPSAAPTKAPSVAPTKAPTKVPSANPTAAPTKAPSAAPTKAPTAAPTKAPSAVPTKAPTAAPITTVPTTMLISALSVPGNSLPQMGRVDIKVSYSATVDQSRVTIDIQDTTDWKWYGGGNKDVSVGSGTVTFSFYLETKIPIVSTIQVKAWIVTPANYGKWDVPKGQESKIQAVTITPATPPSVTACNKGLALTSDSTDWWIKATGPTGLNVQINCGNYKVVPCVRSYDVYACSVSDPSLPAGPCPVPRVISCSASGARIEGEEEATEGGSSSLPVGGIVGIAIAGAVVVAVFIVAVVLLTKKSSASETI